MPAKAGILLFILLFYFFLRSFCLETKRTKNSSWNEEFFNLALQIENLKMKSKVLPRLQKFLTISFSYSAFQRADILPTYSKNQ